MHDTVCLNSAAYYNIYIEDWKCAISNFHYIKSNNLPEHAFEITHKNILSHLLQWDPPQYNMGLRMVISMFKEACFEC